MSTLFPKKEALWKYRYTSRVRYYDVDAMGRVHHSAYFKFMEDARTEMLRDYDITYKEIEESGFMLPVIGIEAKYKNPLAYDELYHCDIYSFDKPSIRLPLYYQLLNEKEQLVVEAKVELCFIDASSMRPCKTPELFTHFFERVRSQTQSQ